jgi:hypothetical protein
MNELNFAKMKATAALKGTLKKQAVDDVPKGPPLIYVRMRCCTCDILIPAGDKDKDPLNYARVGLPAGVAYNPKVHSPMECVDCAMESRRQLEEATAVAEREAELGRMYAEMEREHFGYMSDETIKREVKAGRLSAADGLFEFMASRKAASPEAPKTQPEKPQR